MLVEILDYRRHGNKTNSMGAFIQLNFGNSAKVEHADRFGATVTDIDGDVWDVVRENDTWCKIPAR